MNRLIILSTLVSVIRIGNCNNITTARAMALQALDFEVFGRVQGVFFRKHTKDQADKLGLRGWCQNTSRGTVQGQLQGQDNQLQTMMNWLKNTGSPASHIERTEFRNQHSIEDYTFNNFSIKKN